ncbi:MAG: hypothetical protein IJ717_00025 [Treponema sp.]|nr:hypothetical protein [Treponema sp.]
MKKFSRTIFGLLASAMLVAGSVSFVSCADDDEEETTQTVEVETTTRTVTIGENTYTYTTVGGEVSTSDTVKVNSDGSVTVSASDGSSVTFSADGNTITYKTADNKTYTGSTSTTGSDSDSIELTSESGETVSAEVTTETKTETKTTSGSEATASVTELAYDSDTLNNKVFSYEDEDDGVRYLTFTGGKCYKSSSPDYIGSERRDELFISYNNKIYRSDKATRISGSGLFATFDDGEEYKYTLNSDGTGSIYFYEGSSSFSITFTNNAGLVTISFTYEGETFTGAMYYNGENLYDQKEELTFVKNYKTETQTTGGSEATASVTELAYDSDTLNNKVFSYEDEDDGTRYLIFTGGKCYKSSSPDHIGWEDDELLISYNNKIYRSDKATRSSGSGLFATFDDGEGCKITFKSDGTGSIYFYEDSSSFSSTFTNNAGVVTISFTYEGETMTGDRYYNGENLYDLKEELTFVKNYSAN